MSITFEEYKNQKVLAVIGLGYVGLPLAVEFGKKYKVIGFDVNKNRIKQLIDGVDITDECSKKDLQSASKLTFSSDSEELDDADIYIVTVPTPIDEFNNPDLSYIQNASRLVGKFLASGDTVIFESTVYPGVTEDICVPILAEESGLTYNIDFFGL